MGGIAFVFSGQGAQYPGMGRDLYEASPAAREIFDLAESLRPGTLSQCFSGTKEELSQTINTQPCLFAMDLACAAALAEAGVKAAAAAGFSLGEVAAAAFCGMMPAADAFRAVCKRGEWMDACAQAHPGSMAAIVKLTAEQVEVLCREFSQVYPVNYNSPGQTVVAGAREEMPSFMEKAAAAGGRAIPLAVSGAFHSPFMEDASEKLHGLLTSLPLSLPALPLYANATALPYGENPAELLSRQVKSPVQWQKTVENMLADGYDTFIEVGAGKTLAGLIKKIGGAKRICNVTDCATLQATLEALKEDSAC